MKGTVHAAIGGSAPAGLVLTGHVSLMQGAVMAAVSAGFAMLPDIDSPNSTATKALGTPVHKLIHKLCMLVHTGTATDRDLSYANWQRIHHRDPAHRTLTHTVAVTLALGVVVYGVSWASEIATGFIASLGVFLLWPLRRVTVPFVVFGGAAAGVGAVLLLSPWLMALAAGGGYLSHVIADACTVAGVPVMWPMKIQNKRWWNVRVLGSRIKSGSKKEQGPALGVSLAANSLLLFLMF